MERAAKLAVATVRQYLQENPDIFEAVLWVLFDNKTLAAYQNAVAGEE